MKFEEYLQYDGLGLAELVKNKQVHSSELLSVALERSANINPEINAIIIPMHEHALQRTQQNCLAPLLEFHFWSKTCFRNMQVIRRLMDVRV